VKTVAAAVLRHRIVLRPEAELDGVTADDVVSRILGSVSVPR
jgi:MoxR-like ATPase